ncbi:hypothetical protein L7F22_011764 [Adiantum nelumboides]|nr:hypothetical protein [Adiantum nelumboides]
MHNVGRMVVALWFGVFVFLRVLFQLFEVGVWSSMQEHNLKEMLVFLKRSYNDAGYGESKFKFKLDQSHREGKWTKRRQFSFNVLFVKNFSSPLVKPYITHPLDTILVDDSPKKAVENPPHILLTISSYEGSNNNDVLLNNVLPYLEGMYAYPGLASKFVQQNPYIEGECPKGLNKGQRQWLVFEVGISHMTLLAGKSFKRVLFGLVYIEMCNIGAKAAIDANLQEARLTYEPQTPILAYGTFEKWGIDTIGPLLRATSEKLYIIMGVDNITRWAEATTTTRITAVEVAKFIFEHICCGFGVPLEILSKRGPGFRGDLVGELMKTLKIKRRHSTPYYPHCNGLVEKDLEDRDDDDEEEDDDKVEQAGTSGHPGPDDNDDDDQDQPGTSPSSRGADTEQNQPFAPQTKPPPPTPKENEPEHSGAAGSTDGSQLQLFEKVTIPIGVLTYMKRRLALPGSVKGKEMATSSNDGSLTQLNS